MLLFEFDDGKLFPAQLGAAPDGVIDPDVMRAVRDSVLDLIGKPLFPVEWSGGEGTTTEPSRLVAMDASGQVVSVEVVPALGSTQLVEALARSGRMAALGWLDLGRMYPQGSGAFRRDWNEFRQALPPRPLPGPRLYVVTGHIEAEVRPALEVLADSGVEVFEVTQRSLTDGRRFVEVTEPYRITIPTVTAHAQLDARGRQELAAEDYQRLVAGTSRSASTPTSPPAVAPSAGARPVAPATPAAPPTVKPAVVESAADVLPTPDPSLRDLAAAIGPQPLVWVQLRKGIRHQARLLPEGLISLTDGRLFADPSAAAVAASGRHAADGWRVWRVGEGGLPLGEAVRTMPPRRRSRHAR